MSLTWNYTLLVSSNNFEKLKGLNVLALNSPFPIAGIRILAIFSFIAVLINFISWIWGISRLIYSTSQNVNANFILSRLDRNAIPRNAIIFLGIGFTINIFIFMYKPVNGYLSKTCIN